MNNMLKPKVDELQQETMLGSNPVSQEQEPEARVVTDSPKLDSCNRAQFQ